LPNANCWMLIFAERFAAVATDALAAISRRRQR
jgi:hypothetical protein